MFFNSYGFLFGFLPVVCFVYFLLSRIPGAGTWWMVAASLFFYAEYRVAGLALLIASILWNYLISWLIVSRKRKQGYLALGISLNLLVLCVFKYSRMLTP
jgi:alginate O-acetyltransferase complex protein AlgI